MDLSTILFMYEGTTFRKRPASIKPDPPPDFVFGDEDKIQPTLRLRQASKCTTQAVPAKDDECT